MIQLPISRGLFALIDDADFDVLNQYKWSALKTRRGTFYAVRRIRNNGNPKYIYMHRQVLGVIDTASVTNVDHIDHNGLNNQRANLRPCTRSQNLMNSVPRKNRMYGAKYKGVAWYAPSKKWKAQIKIDGKNKNLGHFVNEVDAAIAYNSAALKHYGEFANLNIIP